MSRGGPENPQSSQGNPSSGAPEVPRAAKVTRPDGASSRASEADDSVAKVTSPGTSPARSKSPDRAQVPTARQVQYAEPGRRLTPGLNLNASPLPSRPQEVATRPQPQRLTSDSDTLTDQPAAAPQAAWRKRKDGDEENRGLRSRSGRRRSSDSASGSAEPSTSDAGGRGGSGGRPPTDGGSGGFADDPGGPGENPQKPEENGEESWIRGSVPSESSREARGRPYRFDPPHPSPRGERQPAPGGGGRGGGERPSRTFNPRDPGEPGMLGRGKRRVTDAVHNITDWYFRKTHPILLTKKQVDHSKTTVEDLALKYDEKPRFADRPVVRNVVGASLTFGSLAGLLGGELKGLAAVTFTGGAIWAIKRLRHPTKLMVENVSTVAIELASYGVADAAVITSSVPDARVALVAGLGAGLYNLRKGRKLSKEKGQLGGSKSLIGTNAAVRDRLTHNIIGGGVRRAKREITDERGRTRKRVEHVEDNGALRNEVTDREIALANKDRRIEAYLRRAGEEVSFLQKTGLNLRYRALVRAYHREQRRIRQAEREIRRWEELQPELPDSRSAGPMDPQVIFEPPSWRPVEPGGRDEYL